MVKRGGSDKRISDRSFYWEIIVSFVIVLLIVLTIYSSIYYSFTGAATADKIFSYNINKIFKTSEKLDLILEGPPVTLTISGSFSGPSFVHVTAKDRLGNNSYTILDSNNLSNLGVITITSPVPSSENEQKNATNKTDQKANQKTIIRDLKYYCSETCSNLNLSNRIELIIDVNGTFELDKISYETSLEKKPPIIINDNMNIDAEEGNSLEINLLDYFNDPNGDNIVFSFRPNADADIRIVKNTMRIVPLKLGEIGIEVVATDFTSVQKAVFQIISSERMQKIYAENFKVVVSDRYSKKEGVSDIEKRDDGKLNINISLEDNRIELFGAEFDETYVNMTENDLVVKVGRIDDDRFGTKAVSVSGLQSLENSRITLEKIRGKNTNVILKCEDFDEELFRCEGVWEEANIPFEETENEITFYAEHFSGYVGADIDVIDIQSYPSLGGNWTVRFTTNGTANLTITGINGTDFTEIPDDNSTINDLKFIDLTCNNQTVPYQLNMSGAQLKSVVKNNYNCSGEGRFTSKVLTAEKHYLEFRYGDKIKYAKNDVLACAANITTSGKTTLTAHLTGIPCAKTGVSILANNVELDCNRYDINGSGIGYGVKIDGARIDATTGSAKNITIRNCDIFNFTDGIIYNGNYYGKTNNENISIINNIIKRTRAGIKGLNSSTVQTNLTRLNISNNNINISNGTGSGIEIGFTAKKTNISIGTIYNNTIIAKPANVDGILIYGFTNKVNISFNNITTKGTAGPTNLHLNGAMGINFGRMVKNKVSIRNNTIKTNGSTSNSIYMEGNYINITGNILNTSKPNGAAAGDIIINIVGSTNRSTIDSNKISAMRFGIVASSGRLNHVNITRNRINSTNDAIQSSVTYSNSTIWNNTIKSAVDGIELDLAKVNVTISYNNLNATWYTINLGGILRNVNITKNKISSKQQAILLVGGNITINRNLINSTGSYAISSNSANPVRFINITNNNITSRSSNTIYAVLGDARIVKNRIISNSTTLSAIYAGTSSGTFFKRNLIENNTIISKSTTAGTGGIEFVESGTTNITVRNNTINSTSDGIITSSSVNNIRIMNNVISVVSEGFEGSTNVATNFTFTGNKINTTTGVGIENDVRFIHTLIKNNVIKTRTGTSGDAFSFGTHNVTIRNNNVTISAFFIDALSKFENSSIYNNTIKITGTTGGIFRRGATALLHVRNVTFTDIRANATAGGANVIAFQGKINITIRNSNFSNLTNSLSVSAANSKVIMYNSVMRPNLTNTAGSILNFTNTTLENPNGKIRFSQVSVNDAITAAQIRIYRNFIDIPTKTIPDLDTKANLTFRNVNYGALTGVSRILRNGSSCNSLICSNKVFNTSTSQGSTEVNRFSNYTVNSTALSCGDSLTSNYTMTENIVGIPCGDIGVKIITGKVRLNCSGYDINGSNTQTGILINGGLQNITIINCFISNFTHGITSNIITGPVIGGAGATSNSRNLSLINNTIRLVRNGIVIDNSTSNFKNFTKFNFSRNRINASKLNGSGIVFGRTLGGRGTNVSLGTIWRNRIDTYQNGSDGILLNGIALQINISFNNITTRGNTPTQKVNQSGTLGINFADLSKSRINIYNNTIKTNGSNSNGLNVHGKKINISGNKINTSSSNSKGIDIINSMNMSNIRFNKINSSFDGISLTSTKLVYRINITRNTINSSSGNGAVFNGTIVNSTIANNTISIKEKDGVGIFLDANSVENNVSFNKIKSLNLSNISGIVLDGSNVTLNILKSNNISNSTLNGIILQSGSRKNRLNKNHIIKAKFGITLSGSATLNNITRNKLNSGNTSIRLLNSQKNNISHSNISNARLGILIGSITDTAVDNNYIHNISFTNNIASIKVINQFRNNISHIIFPKNATFINTSFGNLTFTNQTRWSQTYRRIIDIINMSLNLTTVRADKETGLNTSAHLQFARIPFTGGAVRDIKNNKTFSNCTSTRCSKVTQVGTLVQYDVSNFTQYSNRRNVTGTGAGTSGGTTPQSGGGGKGYNPIYTTAARTLPQCNELWACGEWTVCENERQERICRDVNKCGTFLKMPELSRECEQISVPEAIVMKLSKTNSWWLFWVIAVLALSSIAVLLVSMNLKRKRYAQEYENAYGVDKKRFGIMHKFGLGIANTAQSIKNVCRKIAGSPAISRERDKILTETEIGAFRFEGIFKAIVNAVAGRSIMNYKRYLFLNKSEYRVAGTEKMMKEVNKVMSHKFVPRKDDFSGKIFSVDRTIYNEDVQFSRHDKKSDKAFYGKRRNNPLKSLLSILSIRKGIFPFVLIFLILSSALILQYLTYTGAVTFEKSYSKIIYRQFSQDDTDDTDNVLNFALEGPPVTLTITGSLIGPSSRALIYLEDQFSNRSYVIMNSSALKKPDLIETNASSLVLEEIENNSENLTSGKGFILKSFSRYCLETCGKINTTQKIRIVVKVLNGSIDLTRIDYKAERRPLPPQIVRGNLELLVYSKSPSEINLSSYFNDPNNDKLIYIVGRDESLNPKIIGEVLKITPAETGSKKLRVIATDLTYRRNLEFDINVQDYLNRIVKIDMDEFELAFEDKYGREIGTKEIKENADGTLDINLSFEKKLLSSEAGGNIEINGAKFDSNEITKTDVDVVAKIDEIDEINSTVTTISTKVASIEGIGKFESAILTLPKLNNKTVNVILRCDNFDNEFFVCNSEWKIANVPFKQTEDSVIIYADHFSGYAGGYIDILNVQSYPVLHSNWTVRFKTNGTNNLTITATNGTTFTEVPTDDSSTENDLQFLDLRCGSSPVSFIENISGRQLKSIRSVDYNCSQEGSFTSKVLTSEKHYLEFNFGNTTKIAKNDVLGCGVVLSSANTTTNVSIQINGTQKKWTNCINVTASNIKIQCVSGGSGRGRFVGNGSGTAISLSNATNVTVRNCTFTNWTTGVYLFNHSFNNTITKNNFTSNNYSILTLRSNLTSILNNSFRYNGIDILLNRSSRDIIANNTLRNATNNSINFVGTKVARTIIKKNIFNQSTRSIVYGQSDNISIINNSFFNAGIDAISVESHRSNISWNIFDDTKDDHIDLVGMWAFIYKNSFKDISGSSFASAITFCVDSRYCGNTRIRNNTFRDYNTDPVIYISSLSNMSIMGNEIDLLGNTGQGIRFNSVRNSTIANNTFNTTFTAIQADGDGGDNKLLDNNLVQVQNGYIITHNNEIIKNNRVVVAFANGYGVSVSSGVNNAQIINNTLLTRGTPSNTRGVIVQNSRNISIRNNTIENFTGAGIDIYTTNNSKINKNQINRSKQGIRLSSTSNFNNITLNRILTGNISILLLNASKNNITKNNFTNATLVAIIFGSPDSKMQGGITLNQMADKNYISNNTIKGPRKSLWTVNSMNNNISKQFLPNGTSFMNETYGEVNFTQNINWSATRRKINNIIMIDKNIISVNTTAEANLNRNATLRFFTGAGTLKIYNSSSTNGRFERCLAPRCGGLVTSGTTKGYNVTKWTTYALGTINISITKTVSTALPIMGDYMTYRINITNNANHTQNFTIEDLLPAGVTYISSVPNATLNNRELTFPLKNVSSRKSYIANITVNVTGNHGTNHTNFANVTVYNGTANRTINITVNISIQPRIVTTLASDLGGSGGKGFDPKFTTAVRDISDIPSMFENNIKCNELWLCGEWEECMDNVQIRTCNDLNKCKTFTELPEIQRECGNETAPDETIIGKIRQIPKLLTKSNTIEAKLSLLFFALLVIFLIIVSVQKLHLPEKIEMLKEGFRLKMAKKSEMEISAIDIVMETYDWKKIKEIKKKKIPVPNAKAIIERAKPYEEKVRDIDEEIRGEERRLRKLRL